MKEERLLSASVFMEAMSIALRNLAIDDEICNCIMQNVVSGVEYVQNHSSPIAFLKGKDEDECVILENVTWLEADGSYTKFHCADGKTRVLTANLVSTLRQLMANGWNCFVRIHKSYAVNVHHIKSKIGNVLRVGKAELTIGRKYRESFGKCCFSLGKLG
nr:LytTR family DNA-binding domain-containing protein [uncultured Prevotella sp.]